MVSYCVGNVPRDKPDLVRDLLYRCCDPQEGAVIEALIEGMNHQTNCGGEDVLK